jgi:two-component system, OmpR family, phosphate regulon response regulator OmpR
MIFLMNNALPHILIVDDDERILKLLKAFLSKNGYQISTATSVKEAEECIKQTNFDLLMLDVMMPGVTGIEFAKQIKNNETHAPIILLTALSEPEDRVKGLESGADDYITKPFEPKELLLRTQKLIELYGYKKSESQEKIYFGDIIYDRSKKEIIHGQDVIILSSTEHRLLDVLIDNKNKVVSRDVLSNIMYGIGERSVDVQIVRLRSRIEPDPKQPKFLQTVRHEGYILYI